MVTCDTCLNFGGVYCLDREGSKYGDPIADPLEEIECECYLDKAIGRLFGLGGIF